MEKEITEDGSVWTTWTVTADRPNLDLFLSLDEEDLRDRGIVNAALLYTRGQVMEWALSDMSTEPIMEFSSFKDYADSIGLEIH